MAANEFFNRWSKTKNAEVANTIELVSPQLPEGCATIEIEPAEPAPLPQMQDAEQLHEGSDFSVFMRDGVDESVRRSAMKKLFTNPHFNLMDGLDIYVADYSQPDPLPVGMLASLRHAEMLLNPLAQLAQPLQNLLPRLIAASDLTIATENQNSIASPDIMPASVAVQDDEPEHELITKTDAPHLDNSNDKDPIQV
ncbi:MAG: DUF3306 domain-containing protein [Burkholderiales bacterium]|nr:DUF3306 domain-containing protein [Burkholderiales bacterium]